MSPQLLDVEERDNDEEGFSLRGIKEQLKEKIYHPSVSVTLIVLIILNLIMLIVGSMHINHCYKRLIPVYLIVAGAVGIISKLLPFVLAVFCNYKLETCKISYLIYALYAFQLIWAILGSYWVYSIPKPNFDPQNSLEYCNKATYYLAFWLITVDWVFIIIVLLLATCALICVVVLSKK